MTLICAVPGEGLEGLDNRTVNSRVHLLPIADGGLPLWNWRLNKECQIIGNQEEFMKHFSFMQPLVQSCGKTCQACSQRDYILYQNTYMEQLPFLKIYHVALFCIHELVLSQYELLAHIINLISTTVPWDCFITLPHFHLRKKEAPSDKDLAWAHRARSQQI